MQFEDDEFAAAMAKIIGTRLRAPASFETMLDTETDKDKRDIKDVLNGPKEFAPRQVDAVKRFAAKWKDYLLARTPEQMTEILNQPV